MTYVVGLDAGSPTIPAAEHWIHAVVADLGRSPALVACTHVASRPYPHVAISLSMTARLPRVQLPKRAAAVVAHGGTAPVVAARDVGGRLVASAARAAADHAVGRGGRAVIYPGIERMIGTVRVADVLARTAIERVTVLDGSPPGVAEPPPEAKLDTRDHVRPHWSCGKLTLLVRPASGGCLLPFEGPQPIPGP